MADWVSRPISIFHDICINVNSFNQLAITIECAISTFWLDHYSRVTALAVTAAFSLTWPWVATTLVYVLEQTGTFPTVPQFIMFEAFNVFSVAMFLMLQVHTRNSYKHEEIGNTAQKYKISVNLRTVRALNCLAILTTIRNFVTMGLLFVILWKWRPSCNDYMDKIFSHFYDIAVALYSLVFPLAVILMHEQLRRQFKRRIMRKTSAEISARRKPLSVTGEDLVVNYGTQNEYFKQLASRWDR
ncbi:hypothetical protein AAVH_31192 [Aphelenchoides avenae]|nr:hypothetical protein AAVH_31192 [Aphelenchus avenae]